MKKVFSSLCVVFLGFSAISVSAVANLGALGTSMTGGSSGSSSGGGDPSKFDGFYMGLAVGVTHNNSKIENHAFKKTGVAPGLYMGYGVTFGKVYGAGELEVDYSFTTAKDTAAPTYKMRSTYNAGLVGRIGGVINGSYLPYFRLGFGVHGYKYTGATTKNMKVFYIAPGVGFEAMLGSFLLRLEGGYALPMTVSGVTKSNIQTKPSRAFFKVGGAYKF